MLDRYLPAFFKEDATLTTLCGTRIYRNRAPQANLLGVPYIVVCDEAETDVGQTADVSNDRQISVFNILACHSDNLAAVDPVKDRIIELLKDLRNQLIPVGSPQIWVQCVIIKNIQQFNIPEVDGNERPMVGYLIVVKAAYDPPG